MTDKQKQITCLLEDLSESDPRAASELLPLIYEDLRRLAEQRMAQEPAGHTLQATALVHEAYLRILGDGEEHWNGRGHFFGAAAEAMRRILVERARRYAREKHGGSMRRMSLGAAEREPRAQTDLPEVDLLALDDALTKLEQVDEVRAKLVKLRFFAGLSIERAAEVMGMSPATANRHWAFARAWICERMTREQ